MERVSVAQARDNLDELVKRAASGEEIVISDALGDVVRLQPLRSASANKRVPGRWKGRIQIPDDKLLEPLTKEELAWLSGESSS